MCPREHFALYKSLSRLVLCYKKVWATLLHLYFTCYSFQNILSQDYLLLIISMLAENTLLKTACHFLLLLVGFDTLTYRKDYDLSPILVGHHVSISQGRAWSRKVCSAKVNRACWVSWCTPVGKLIYSNSRVHDNGRSELYPDLIQLELDTWDIEWIWWLQDRFLARSLGRTSGCCYNIIVTIYMLFCSLLLLQDASLR
jgi:hypothetical protein